MSPPCVILLGGSGALGRVVAAELGRRGARVGLTYHRGRDVAEKLTREIDGAVARELDLTVAADIPRVLDGLVADLGGVDALVHCAALLSAGEGGYDKLGAVGEAGFDRLFAVNVRSAFLAVQHLAGVMRGGNVVLLAGMDSVKAVPSSVPYVAAGGALVAMARGMAKELGPKGVRVNVVASGILDAGIGAAIPADLKAQYLRHCGLRRVGRREEVAGMVTFLALDNTYVTGQAVVVDGGL